jgi:hypothetical protein
MLKTLSKASLIAALISLTGLVSAQSVGPVPFGLNCLITLQGIQNNDQIVIAPATGLGVASAPFTFTALFNDGKEIVWSRYNLY